MTAKQYDVYWVDLNPTRGSEMNKIRPCVIVSPNDMNKYLNTIIIAPITSIKRSYPFRVKCDIGFIALDQLRTVDKTRINDFILTLSINHVLEMKHILQEMLIE
jgi:mRNA interferase MazF